MWVAGYSHVPTYYSTSGDGESRNLQVAATDIFETAKGLEDFPCVDPTKVKPESSRVNYIVYSAGQLADARKMTLTGGETVPVVIIRKPCDRDVCSL